MVYRQLFAGVFVRLVIVDDDCGVVVEAVLVVACIVGDIVSPESMKRKLVAVVDIELVAVVESRTNELERVEVVVAVVERTRSPLAWVAMVAVAVVERMKSPLALRVVVDERMTSDLLVAVVVVVERRMKSLALEVVLALVVVAVVVVGVVSYRNVVVVAGVASVVVEKMRSPLGLVVAVVERMVVTSLASTWVFVVVENQSLVWACTLVDNVVRMMALVRIVVRMVYFCNFYRPFCFFASIDYLVCYKLEISFFLFEF